MEAMRRYGWPGNIRQLLNALEYSAITSRGGTIEAADLPGYVRGEAAAAVPAPAKGRSGIEEIAAALERAGGNRTRAARSLGISRVTLWKKLKAAGRA